MHSVELNTKCWCGPGILADDVLMAKLGKDVTWLKCDESPNAAVDKLESTETVDVAELECLEDD